MTARVVVEEEEIVVWTDVDSVEVEMSVPVSVAVSVSEVTVPVVVEVNVLELCAKAPVAAKSAIRLVSFENCILLSDEE